MTVPITFLGVDEVLRIHERMITEFGGTLGVRDHGLLQSAVHLPRAQFSGKYLHDNVPEMAAACLYHLCCNHPFVDGNKRTALASAEIFILVNDRQLTATNEELEELTMAVAAGTRSKKEVTSFMMQQIV